MGGDGRRKGGTYSTNPATMRTRAYHASLNPEKAAARKTKFSEYRALRGTCIRVSESDIYKAETTRDGKLHQLRRACLEVLAGRTAAKKPPAGSDIDSFVTRFHDNRWMKKHRAEAAASASTAQRPPPKHESSAENDPKEAEGCAASEKAEVVGLKDVEVAIADHDDAIADLINNETEIVTQLNAVSGQVLHISEVATIQQARIDALEEMVRRDREVFNFVLMALAEFGDM